MNYHFPDVSKQKKIPLYVFGVVKATVASVVEAQISSFLRVNNQ